MKLIARTIPGAKAFALSCLVAGAAAAQDADGDGIDDAYEMVLAEMFAPHLKLHPSEIYRPSTVEWYLFRLYDDGSGNGGLRFHHIDCSDHPILGQPSAVQLVSQQHTTTQSILCTHSGSVIYSGNAVPYDPSVNDGFFLQIPNDPTDLTVRAGMPAPTDWRAYVHVEESKTHPDHYNIQYHWFYPYNGPYQGGPAGAHEGDWEHVTLRVKADTLALSAAHFSAHGSIGSWYPASSVEMLSGRPVVYSAWNSHASYPSAGTWPYAFFFSDVTASGGLTQDFSGRLVPLDELWKPKPGQEWLRYGGRWGEIGFGGAPDGTGPSGPALQPYWKLEHADLAPTNYHFVSTGPDTAPVPNTHASVLEALTQASAGSTIWLLDGNYADLQSPTYTVPLGTVFDRNQIWSAGLSGPVVITAQ